MSDEKSETKNTNPNVSRRALIGGIAGILVLGAGGGVVAGVMGKDNNVVPETTQPTVPAKVEPTVKPVEIEVEQDELEKKVVQKPNPAPAEAPAPVIEPINPADIPEHEAIPQEQIDRENEKINELLEGIDTSDIKPVGG